jgi:lysophospholipase L1-like esterase
MRGSKSLAHALALTRTHRILCFGDSLTAGLSGMNFYPYAPYLEQALESTQVRHAGFSGWTSTQLAEAAEGDRGLATLIRKVHNPAVSLVIILAGTNDLAYSLDSENIAQSVLNLHRLALEAGAPRTLAIGIPESAYQSVHIDVKTAAALVNKVLRESQSQTMKYVEFPFDYKRGDENWHPDGLHFTETGYRVLGEYLAPTVKQILCELEESERQEP